MIRVLISSAWKGSHFVNHIAGSIFDFHYKMDIGEIPPKARGWFCLQLKRVADFHKLRSAARSASLASAFRIETSFQRQTPHHHVKSDDR